MSQKGASKWIEDVLVPRILEHEELRGATFKKMEVQLQESMKDNFASDMLEVNLLLDHHGNNKPLFLLLKMVNESEKVRKLMLSDKQFFNEIHFYSSTMNLFMSHLPSDHMKKFESFLPRCYYSYYNKEKTPETIEDAIIVMENLKYRGFKLGDRTSLDLKQCTLALQGLGSFHAFSYFMKERDLKTFKNKIVKHIHDTNYIPCKREITNIVFGASEQRVIGKLAKQLHEDDAGLAKLRSLASKDAFDVFLEQIQPQEPLSVLCHGDFLRNNILFRYENGEPVDVKFIDFQMVRYASPVIDVSLLICMNTTHELRAAHFDELLQVYHASLTQTLASLLGKSKEELDPCYSYDSFLKEFRKRAVFGYLVAIEFMPAMYANEEELAAMVKLDIEERGSPAFIATASRLGGERVNQALTDLARDMIEKKCL